MNPTTIDRIVLWAAVPMIVGVGCWFAGLAISTTMLVSLGAMGRSFSTWRTERGLWMLSALFLTMFGPIHVLLIYHSVLDAVAGGAIKSILAVDVFIGTSALGFMVRFLWAVTYWNRRLVSRQLER